MNLWTYITGGIVCAAAIYFVVGRRIYRLLPLRRPAESRAEQPDPGPRYDYEDPDPPTMPMHKLQPFVDDIRRAERNRGREEGRAEALAEKTERPPWMKPLDKSRAARRDSKANEQHAGYHPERDQ